MRCSRPGASRANIGSRTEAGMILPTQQKVSVWLIDSYPPAIEGLPPKDPDEDDDDNEEDEEDDGEEEEPSVIREPDE